MRILSSAHLAGDGSTELSELEFGLIVAGNAFGRWVVRCMAAAGVPDLTLTDVLVLHHVHHRGRPKKLADVCFTLNYEDSHVVNYALKKLVGAGLLRGDKQGKEVFYATRPAARRQAGQGSLLRDAPRRRRAGRALPGRARALPAARGAARGRRARRARAHRAAAARALGRVRPGGARRRVALKPPLGPSPGAPS